MEPQLEIVLGVVLCQGPQDDKGGGGRQQHTEGLGAQGRGMEDTCRFPIHGAPKHL
jgi:hypothetical protein